MKADLEKPFVVTSVCRQDLVEAGIPLTVVESLNDEDMQILAARLGEMYVEFGSFWTDIADAFKILKIQLVMRQAIKAFSPLAESEAQAIHAAYIAGAQCIHKVLGIDETSLNQEELRQTALKEWQLYVAPKPESETQEKQQEA